MIRPDIIGETSTEYAPTAMQVSAKANSSLVYRSNERISKKPTGLGHSQESSFSIGAFIRKQSQQHQLQKNPSQKAMFQALN